MGYEYLSVGILVFSVKLLHDRTADPELLVNLILVGDFSCFDEIVQPLLVQE